MQYITANENSSNFKDIPESVIKISNRFLVDFSRYITQIIFAKIQHNKQLFIPCLMCITNTSDKLGTHGIIYKSTYCCKRKLRPAAL